MAGRKRINRTFSRPGDAPVVKPKIDKFLCTRCGTVYTTQKGNFPASKSPLFKENYGYLPVCNKCADALYDHYKEALGSGAAAMERICMKFDIYWNPESYESALNTGRFVSLVRAYISRVNIAKHGMKTYDDTLDEKGAGIVTPLSISDFGNDEEESANVPEIQVSPETVAFWGSGFTQDAYIDLDSRYKNWTANLDHELSLSEQALYKQVCLQELDINRKMMMGKPIEQGQNVLKGLLASLNINPDQKKDDDSADLESTPLGVWAKRWEDMRPIPDDEPDPSIIGYITTWFYGHLGKAFGFKNTTSRLYDEAMNKYRVEKPEFASDEDDDILVDLFGKGTSTDDIGGDTT